MITNTESGTNVQEIAEGIFRINTPVALPGGTKFNFNQYLIADGASLIRALAVALTEGDSRIM